MTTITMTGSLPPYVFLLLALLATSRPALPEVLPAEAPRISVGSVMTPQPAPDSASTTVEPTPAPTY